MYKIITNKWIFKSKFNIKKDTIFILPYIFVTKWVIEEKDWSTSRDNIFSKFNLNYRIEKIDGRKKEIKEIKNYFTWRILINN